MLFQKTFHSNVKLKNGTIDRYVCARCKWELQKRAYISSFHEEIVHWTGYTMYAHYSNTGCGVFKRGVQD